MSTRLTVIGDETGTPFVENEPFIFAGVHFRGDVDALDEEWTNLRRTLQLPRKARKYSRENYLALVDFILKHEMIPFAALILPDAALMQSLRSKEKTFSNVRGPNGLTRYRPRDLFWIHTTIPTIAQLIISSLNIHGRIESIHIWFDQYNLENEELTFLRKMVQDSFQANGVMQDFLNKYSKRPDGAGAMSGRGSALYNVEQDVQMNFVGKGKLVDLADAVASLFGRIHQNDPRIADASDVLKIGFSDKTSLSSDNTESFRTVVNMSPEDLAKS
jgi:hypothetical protein